MQIETCWSDFVKINSIYIGICTCQKHTDTYFILLNGNSVTVCRRNSSGLQRWYYNIASNRIEITTSVRFIQFLRKVFHCYGIHIAQILTEYVVLPIEIRKVQTDTTFKDISVFHLLHSIGV